MPPGAQDLGFLVFPPRDPGVFHGPLPPGGLQGPLYAPPAFSRFTALSLLGIYVPLGG